MRTTFEFTDLNGKKQYIPKSVYFDEELKEYVYDGGKQNECLNKLGKYENIDDDLGIEWSIVYQALKDGIYWVYNAVEGRSIQHTKKVKGLGFNETGWFICEGWFDIGCPILLYLKDYGKTWALTKKELE